MVRVSFLDRALLEVACRGETGPRHSTGCSSVVQGRHGGRSVCVLGGAARKGKTLPEKALQKNTDSRTCFWPHTHQLLCGLGHTTALSGPASVPSEWRQYGYPPLRVAVQVK